MKQNTIFLPVISDSQRVKETVIQCADLYKKSALNALLSDELCMQISEDKSE